MKLWRMRMNFYSCSSNLIKSYNDHVNLRLQKMLTNEPSLCLSSKWSQFAIFYATEYIPYTSLWRNVIENIQCLLRFWCVWMTYKRKKTPLFSAIEKISSSNPLGSKVFRKSCCFCNIWWLDYTVTHNYFSPEMYMSLVLWFDSFDIWNGLHSPFIFFRISSCGHIWPSRS